MSLLIVQLQNRRRLGTATSPPANGPAAGAAAEFVYAFSADGLQVQHHGRCAASLLPRASEVVAAVAETDIAFHRITCPKAPAARLRAALGGVLEDTLLDDPTTLHLALQPAATAGQPVWVAVLDKAWLVPQIDALEAAGLQVDRVAPLLSPLPASGADTPDDGPFRLHIQAAEGGHADAGTSTAQVSLAHAGGVSTWPLQGTLARALLPDPLPADLRCSASPALVQTAEAWLGRPVAVLTAPERLLQAAAGAWNLRQFDLAPRHRGAARLRAALQQLRSPAWAPVRWGLGGLVIAHLVGLNAWAWQQRAELQTRRDTVLTLMRTTHPQVRAILDAPLQMRRENETLRAAAGRAGDTDLEPMLQAAASAWPDTVPLQTLKFEGQQLSLGAPALGEADVQRLRGALTASGWQVEGSAGLVTLRRGAAGAGVAR
jgi:general secretion pathway protein L